MKTKINTAVTLNRTGAYFASDSVLELGVDINEAEYNHIIDNGIGITVGEVKPEPKPTPKKAPTKPATKTATGKKGV